MSLRLKLFASYALVVVVTVLAAALGSTLLFRQQANRLALDNLQNTARPISIQLGALVRGEATLAEVVANLQEQADNNGVYIFFTDGNGVTLRQFVPQGESPVTIPPGSLAIDLSGA